MNAVNPKIALETPERPSGRAAEIVAAARAIVEERGVAAVTMRGVGKAVGISGPALYRHFADRASLLAAVAAEAGHEFGAHLAGAMGEPTPEAQLAETGRRYLEFAAERPGLFALLFDSADALPPPPADASGAGMPPSLAFLVARVRACAPALTGPALLEAALEVWALVHGLTSLYQRGGGAALFSRAEYQAMTTRMILRAASSISTRTGVGGGAP